MLNKGFTLIELMIVIAIIAIIAAVAIPSLIKSRISAHEGAAAAGLKTFNGMMGTFKKKGYNTYGRVYPHGTGGNATNRGRYCALYYEVNNNEEKVTLIGVADANADCRADGNTDPAEVMGDYTPAVKTTGARMFLGMSTFTISPKAGYFFGLSISCGTAFSYNGTQAKNHYGIVAFPQDYGSSGESTFAISEEGTVYTMDFGDAYLRQFPGEDPVKEGWQVAE